MSVTEAVMERVPPHVPPELVMDFDILRDPAFQGDPHAGLHGLQRRRPMFYTPRGRGLWVVTDGAVMTEIYNDTDRFTAKDPAAGGEHLHIPMGLDPPEHGNYRRLIDPLLAPRAIAAQSETIRNLAVELIEAVRARGECEFVSEIAEPFPVTIFLHLADLPIDELPKFRGWAKTMFHDPDRVRKAEAARTIASYIGAMIPKRRADPGQDLLSALLEGQVEGRPLRDEELLSMMFTIFGGGLDTVLNTMSFIIRFLADNPGHRRQLLDDPALIPKALEELMRRHSIASLFRVARNDMTFHGVQLKAGDRLWCSTIMIAMDEALAPEPLRVDFNRTTGRNPIFGVGPHHCPGRYLARLELKIFLEEWLRRIPHFTVAPDAVTPILTGASMGLSSLPLRWVA